MIKKGISPLIAWVLLVAFTVSTGFIIVKWAIEQTDDLDLTSGTNTNCNEVQFSVENVCILNNEYNDTINISIKNNGYFTINRLTIGRETTLFPKESCTHLNVYNNPGNVSNIDFKAGSKNSDFSNIKFLVDCDEDLNGKEILNQSNQLVELEIVPWIKIDDKDFHCVEKRIVLNNVTELNKFCS